VWNDQGSGDHGHEAHGVGCVAEQARTWWQSFLKLFNVPTWTLQWCSSTMQMKLYNHWSSICKITFV
jgi:hypothetical protein